MKKKIELLAPGGDVDSIKAAILAGANAVYCGLDKFNARNRAKNISFENLNGILRLAHQHNCEVFLTLNIIILESEISSIIKLFNKLIQTTIDGLIIQDLGLFYLLTHYFPTLKIHASTQLTTHNEGQIKFLSQLNTKRVNLSRELDISQIKELSTIGHENNLLTEVFVHGSNCISFSGLCYMSSVSDGNSGNRGRCSQPCREQYLTTAEGVDFPLNIKDNSAFSSLRELADAGVDSVKIEGRIKKYHYVYTVVSSWRKHLQNFYAESDKLSDDSGLRKVFNRDFSDSFLKNEISKNIFIDNPRDNSALYFSQQIAEKSALKPEVDASLKPLNIKITEIKKDAEDKNLSLAKRKVYAIKSAIIDDVKERIEHLSIDKAALRISVSGQVGFALKVRVKTPERCFFMLSDSKLKQTSKNNKCINEALLLSRFKAFNEGEHYIETLDLKELQSDLFIPFKEITQLRNKILCKLNGSTETPIAIDAPRLIKQTKEKFERQQKATVASLSILISSEDDLYLAQKNTVTVYFQLPNSFKKNSKKYIDLFNNNKKLIPWFPAVLIGENYHEALKILKQLSGKKIVTNNTGIAYQAYQQAIPWIAGPYLNSINSFSLLSLKEHFNCHGAFISNELSKGQMKRIKKPHNFELYYSIYHPIVLMSSKVCFFHQVTGCKKNIVDNSCIQRCEKSSFITNLNQTSYFINKRKANYHAIYNQENFLNTEINNDFRGFFSSFFIDLRNIETDTKVTATKSELVFLFENHLQNKPLSVEQLKKNIQHSTNSQYIKGI